MGKAGGGKCIICYCGELRTEEPKILKAEDRIDLCVRNKELGELAEHFHELTENEILVPVSELRKPISMRLEDITISESMKELGLFPVPPASAS